MVSPQTKQARRNYRNLAPYIVAVLLLPLLELYYRHTTELPRVARLGKRRSVTNQHQSVIQNSSHSHPKLADQPNHNTGAYSVLKVTHDAADGERTVPWNFTKMDTQPKARLIVMTYNRARSLRRLLESISEAEYVGHRVDVDIWIDRASTKDSMVGVLNSSVHDVARSFVWPHGAKTVYARHKHGGLYAQWFDTWEVDSKKNEFAVFFEDDLEVSPWFYVWLQNARHVYGSDPEVGAFTLCRLRLRNRRPLEGPQGYIQLPSGTHAFKYRFQGSWGFAPQPRYWEHFLKWMYEMRENGTKPYVDGLITTNWYKGQERRSGLDYAPTMWTQWWVKYADVFGIFTVTPALDNGFTLAANWLEPGLHFMKKSSKSDAPVFRGNLSQLKWPKNIIKLDWDGNKIED